jgi:hypothetical protein
MVCHFITVGIHHMFFLSIWTYKDIYIYIILSMICHFTSVGAIICFYCGKLKISKVIMIVTFLIKLWPNTANLYNCVYYFWSSQIIGFKLLFKSSYRGDRKLLGCWKYLVEERIIYIYISLYVHIDKKNIWWMPTVMKWQTI